MWTHPPLVFRSAGEIDRGETNKTQTNANLCRCLGININEAL